MKKSIFKYIYIVLGIAILVLCVILLTRIGGSGDNSTSEPTVIYPSIVPTTKAVEKTTEAEKTTEEVTTEEPTTEAPYVSPIDWESLWAINTEVYAWLYIPGTEISYPVCQREGDDTYYIIHTYDFKSANDGAIMSESAYNNKEFTDPVTILYGHKMRSKTMFGTLQETYDNKEGFDSHSEIIVYLPDKELHYTVFTATPFERYHILETFDFSAKKGMRAFLRALRYAETNETQVNESLNVTSDDKLLVLSTCLMGNVSRRYLVIARLNEKE